MTSSAFRALHARVQSDHKPVYSMRPCPECGLDHLLPDAPDAICFRCDMRINGARYSVYASIDKGPEDSTDPRRVADGTSIYNVGLPGVDTVIGKRADGKPKLAYRPITNNELGTSRARIEYAKRHGLEVVATPKKAIA